MEEKNPSKQSTTFGKRTIMKRKLPYQYYRATWYLKRCSIGIETHGIGTINQQHRKKYRPSVISSYIQKKPNGLKSET